MTPFPELTDRHRQIIRCRCDEDLTNDETGFALGISGQTVKNHVSKMLIRLRCHSMHGVCTKWGRATPCPDELDALRCDEV